MFILLLTTIFFKTHSMGIKLTSDPDDRLGWPKRN